MQGDRRNSGFAERILEDSGMRIRYHWGCDRVIFLIGHIVNAELPNWEEGGVSGKYRRSRSLSTVACLSK